MVMWFDADWLHSVRVTFINNLLSRQPCILMARVSLGFALCCVLTQKHCCCKEAAQWSVHLLSCWSVFPVRWSLLMLPCGYLNYYCCLFLNFFFSFYRVTSFVLWKNVAPFSIKVRILHDSDVQLWPRGIQNSKEGAAVALNATKRDSEMATEIANGRCRWRSAASGKHSRVYMSRRWEFPQLLPVDFISFMCLSVGMKSCRKANKDGDRSAADRGQSKHISNSCLFL